MKIAGFIADLLWSISFGLYVLLSYKLDGGEYD